MSDQTKLEAVMINGEKIAIRISFSHEKRFFARQYAISEEMNYEQAVRQAYRYRDRIINRSPDPDRQSEIRKPEEHTVSEVVIRSARGEEMLEKARQDVRRVLDLYRPDPGQHEYLNVFGVAVKKDALLD